MLDAVFGEQLSDMLEICGLATDPKQQGKGYGKNLVHFINAMVRQPGACWRLQATERLTGQSDAQGRAVYAVTSDAQGFYESLGYTLALEDFIGIGNPKWN